ncbi:MAG: DUF4082 domain-containing protein [Eubacteriales bacterium]
MKKSLFRVFLSILTVALILSFISMFAYAADPVPFLSIAATGERNDFTGNVGYRFKMNEDVVVTSMARPINGGITANHTVYLWEFETETLLTSVTITTTTPADSLGFLTMALTAPVTLKAGIEYCLVSEETADGDKWYDFGTGPDGETLSPNSDGTIMSPCFTGENGVFPSSEYSPGEDNEGYVGVTIFYVKAADYNAVAAETEAAQTEAPAPDTSADTAAAEPSVTPAAQTADPIILVLLCFCGAGITLIKKRR